MTIKDLFEIAEIYTDVWEIKCDDYRSLLPVTSGYFKHRLEGTDVWNTKVKSYESQPYFNGEKLMVIYL